jgi:threonine dehydrogenase-like Zn-dependent dehydrogenase
VLDRNSEGPKPSLVRDLGGTFYTDISVLDVLRPDVIMECTAATPVIAAVIGRTGPAGIVCLAGVSAPDRKHALDLGQLNRTLVLANDVVFGTVNANRGHYEAAAAALAPADKNWLKRLITRRLPLEEWAEALAHKPGDVKAVIDFTL